MLVSGMQKSDSIIDTYIYIYIYMVFPGGASVKYLPVNAGDARDAD